MNKQITEQESLAMLKALADEIRKENKWTGLERVRIIQVKETIANQWRDASKSAEETVEKAESLLKKLVEEKATSEDIHNAQLELARKKGVQQGMLQTFATIGMLIQSGVLQDSEVGTTATIGKDLAKRMQPHFDEADRLMELEIEKRRAAHNSK